MFTLKNNITYELIINKSKFITYLYKIESVSDAINYLSDLKKEYKDATHICYAYVYDNTKRFNDDGEPSGTAGMPILNVLESNKLNHVLAIVIRYFGGIKLGAGGLLRAYSNAISKCLNTDSIVPIIKEEKIRITFKYNNLSNVNYILKDCNITYKEYDEDITYEFIYEEDKFPKNLDSYIIKKESL